MLQLAPSRQARQGAGTVSLTLTLLVMSGIDDGLLLRYRSEDAGHYSPGDLWTLSIGRRDDNDIILRSDTFVSRNHAKLFWRGDQWWLEDCNSTNGTFVENLTNYFEDERVTALKPLLLQSEQLFRIGRTWLKIKAGE